MNEDIRKMNDAAHQAYAQDVSIGAVGATANTSTARKKPVDPMALPHYDSDEEFGPNVLKTESTAVKEPSLWCEARTDDGHTYYWNVKTNESLWKKPKEGFMTLAEYEKLNELALQQQQQQQNEQMKHTIDNADEIASRYRREQLKKYQKRTEEPKTEKEASTSYAGQYGGQPYGKWQTVEVKPEKKPVDLELPKQDIQYVAIATKTEEPPVKKFKEKTITTLEDVGEVSSVFKKRKFGFGKNIRKATDDST